jgi:hypothetical protein
LRAYSLHRPACTCNRSRNPCLNKYAVCYGPRAYKSRAAYNNTSEIELEDVDLLTTQTSDLSLYPIGTKVAKQFEGDDQQLVWFEGVVQRFDEGLYWVLYSDGDSEDMDTDEVRDAVQNYKPHLQPEEVVAEVEFDAANSSPPDTSADIDDTMLVVVNDPAPAVVDSAPSSASSSSSELAVAMQAMTAAAEQLAAAAARIEAAVQTQRVQQPQQQLQHQQQQQTLTLQPWLLRQHWQQAILQQQQQRLAYYQLQQMLYWQQMYSFKQQC